MKRVALLTFAFLVSLSSPAIADPIRTPGQEPIDPLPLLQTVLPSGVFGVGDIDPTTLVVTDTDLALAGSAFVAMPTLDPPALVVDDDKVQCPQATFTSINVAIAAANPGDTIRVCPGTYKENVLVNKSVHLQAVRQQGEASQCQAAFPPDPTQVAIVNYPTGLTIPDIGINIMANNVQVTGFTVTPLSVPPASGGVGIFGDPNFSGQQIEHNVIEHNTTGLYLNTNGVTETFVRNNCFRDNNFPPNGAAAGNGIYSDQGINNVTIDNNFFTGNTNASIVFDQFKGTVSFVRITHNSIVNDNAIVLFNSAGNVIFHDILISQNFSSGATNGSAIFVGRGTDNVEVSFNRLENGAFNGISIRNDAFLTAGPPSTNLLVFKNKATGFARSGIRLGGPAGTNTHIQQNRSANNGIDGMRAESSSSAYVIELNHMRFNAEHDCHDDSTGTFTPAFVANQWINDFGETENKAGLCKHASS